MTLIGDRSATSSPPPTLISAPSKNIEKIDVFRRFVAKNRYKSMRYRHFARCNRIV